MATNTPQDDEPTLDELAEQLEIAEQRLADYLARLREQLIRETADQMPR